MSCSEQKKKVFKIFIFVITYNIRWIEEPMLCHSQIKK